MYTGDGFEAAIVLAIATIAAPFIWMAWWFLADLGEAAAGRPAATRREVPVGRHQPAA